VFVAVSWWRDPEVLLGGLGRLMSSVNRERMVNRLDSGANSISFSEGGRRGTAVLGLCQELISLSSLPFLIFFVYSLG
jgi:hypothetical protein